MFIEQCNSANLTTSYFAATAHLPLQSMGVHDRPLSIGNLKKVAYHLTQSSANLPAGVEVWERPVMVFDIGLLLEPVFDGDPLGGLGGQSFETSAIRPNVNGVGG